MTRREQYFRVMHSFEAAFGHATDHSISCVTGGAHQLQPQSRTTYVIRGIGQQRSAADGFGDNRNFPVILGIAGLGRDVRQLYYERFPYVSFRVKQSYGPPFAWLQRLRCLQVERLLVRRRFGCRAADQNGGHDELRERLH